MAERNRKVLWWAVVAADVVLFTLVSLLYGYRLIQPPVAGAAMFTIIIASGVALVIIRRRPTDAQEPSPQSPAMRAIAWVAVGGYTAATILWLVRFAMAPDKLSAVQLCVALLLAAFGWYVMLHGRRDRSPQK